MGGGFPWVSHRTQREVAETERLRSMLLVRRLSWGEARRLEHLELKERAALHVG